MDGYDFLTTYIQHLQELIQKYKNLGGDVNLFLNLGKQNGHD